MTQSLTATELNPNTPPTAEDLGRDRRWDQRRKCHATGVIYVNAGSTALNCIIRDQSSTGARLELKSSSTLPNLTGKSRAESLWLDMSFDRARVQCQAVWSNDQSVGVRFTSPMQPLPPRKQSPMRGKDKAKPKSFWGISIGRR